MGHRRSAPVSHLSDSPASSGLVWQLWYIYTRALRDPFVLQSVSLIELPRGNRYARPCAEVPAALTRLDLIAALANIGERSECRSQGHPNKATAKPEARLCSTNGSRNARVEFLITAQPRRTESLRGGEPCGEHGSPSFSPYPGAVADGVGSASLAKGKARTRHRSAANSNTNDLQSQRKKRGAFAPHKKERRRFRAANEISLPRQRLR